MKRFAFAMIAGILSSLAFASVAGACWAGWYQPRVPKSLNR